MQRCLIIAKVIPTAEQQVSEIFAESDQSDLPSIAGIRHRSLYRLHDVYIHLMETEQIGIEAVEAARRHPEFARISDRLRPYIAPYLPTWQSPSDAIARCFYHWTAAQPGRSQ